MKYLQPPYVKISVGRSPQGERGLKYPGPFAQVQDDTSLPARGAWIEIPYVTKRNTVKLVAPRKGSVD